MRRCGRETDETRSQSLRLVALLVRSRCPAVGDGPLRALALIFAPLLVHAELAPLTDVDSTPYFTASVAEAAVPVRHEGSSTAAARRGVSPAGRDG